MNHGLASARVRSARALRTLAAGSLAAVLVVFAPAGRPASAHAELTRSNPAADSILETAPLRLTLSFSEEPELRFSEIRVVDRQNRQVDRGDLRADPADRLSLITGLRDLAPGTYTVTWKALSAADGHVTRGVFVFTIGLDQVPTGAVVVGTSEGSTATPDEALVRLVGYIGLLLILGAFPFLRWVLLPALAQAGAAYDTTALALHRAWMLQIIGVVVAALAFIATLVAQTATAFSIPLLDAFGGRMLAVALGTRFGMLWWAQVGVVVVLGAIVLLARGKAWPTLLEIGCVFGLGLLLLHALGTHAAAVPDGTPAAVGLDWVHLAGVVTWIGGLAYLLLSLWSLSHSQHRGEAARVAARIVPRFSVVAAICVGSILLTGIYQSWLHVGSFAALVGTPYGQALLVKLALIVPLLLLGAVNLIILRPRLQAAAGREGRGEDLVRRLRQTVAAEIAFAVGVLLAVGVMTSLQPARDALAAQGIERSATVEDVRAAVQVQPGLASVNRFDVFLTDRQGRPLVDAEKVSLRFNMQAMDMGESELVAAPRGDGHYIAQGGNLAMAGPWRVDVLVRRAGRDDVRAPVLVDVAAAPTGNASPARPPLGEGNLVLGIELLVVAVGGVALAVWAFVRRARVLRWAAPLALVTLITGGALMVQGAMARSVNSVRNPIPPVPASIARGGALYAENCAICHGDTGRGDGLAGIALNPRPADFRVHLAAGHTDGQLFDWMTNGFPGTAMPKFKDQLSEEDRWNVLNYIQQSFGPGASPPVSTAVPN